MQVEAIGVGCSRVVTASVIDACLNSSSQGNGEIIKHSIRSSFSSIAVVFVAVTDFKFNSFCSNWPTNHV